MFAECVVEEKLCRFKKEFGWKPEPHSIDEVDDWTKRLETAFEIDEKGNIYYSRTLTRAERFFVANERALCAASCEYFLTRYFWIKAKSRIFRFAFRRGQWIVFRMLQELDAMGVSKMMQILKARQLGISVLSEGIMTWGALFVPGVSSQIGSADGQKTQIMLSMMTLAIDQLPPWLPPTQTRKKVASDRALLEFSQVGSLIMVQPGSIRGGMGQGTTPTMVHLSEVSQYTNPVQQLDEGLFKALGEGPEIVVILESTGDPNHQSAWWWEKMWKVNRDNYWEGRARFLPVFLPWSVETELYPDKDWLKKFPLPAGYTPNEETRAQVCRAEAYVHTSEMLRRVLGEDWKMSLEKQWFWEFNHEDHKRRGVEKSWYRQYPCDDYEALLGDNDKVASNQLIEVMDQSSAKQPGTKVYMLAGDGVEKKHEPQDDVIWYGKDAPERIRFHWDYESRTTRKKERMDWMFVPVMPKPEEKNEPLGKILIYEEVRAGFDYSVGIDTGTGVGGDRTAITVTRYGTESDPDYQVAEFAADSISLADCYTWIAALTAYYAKYMEWPPHPKLIIEQRRKYGDLPYHILSKTMGFRRWHDWVTNIDKKKYRESGGQKDPRQGFYTNAWSRPALLSNFLSSVENGWYVVRSKWLADEIKGLEQRVTGSGATRVDHASDEHDDRVFAAAMSYWTFHTLDVMAERSKKRYDRADEVDLVIERGPAEMQIQIPGGKFWELSR